MAMIKCNECGAQVSDKAASCPHCGNPIAMATVNTQTKIQPVFENGKIVVCTRCKSQHVQLYKVETHGAHGAKTKTSYSANLNPLKPFTFVNKKEKTVRKASSGYTVNRYQCLDCGKEFYFNPSLSPQQEDISGGDLLLILAVIAFMIFIIYLWIF